MAGFTVGEEGVEVGADLGVDFVFRGGEGLAFGDQVRDVGGEFIEAIAGLFVGVFAGAVGRVVGRAGAPDLVGFAEVVAGFSEEEGVGRVGVIPDGAAENRATAGAPEMLAREQGAAAGRATGGGDEGFAEEHALAGDAVEVRRLHGVAEGAGTVELGVGAGVAAPVVGEDKEDVGTFGGFGGSGGERSRAG